MKTFIKIFPILLGAIFFLVLGFWLGEHTTTKPEEAMVTENTTEEQVTAEKPEEDKNEFENELQKKGDEWAELYPNSLEFRVYDLENEESYTYTNNGKEEKYVTASIAKVAIAMLLLHEKEENHKDLTDEETDLLSSMITRSDNEAATTILDSLGGYSSLQQLFDDLEMNDTKADEETWGKTTTTTKDQIKLLQELYTPSQYLNEDSQEQIIDLMDQIDPEQSWGVYAGSSNVTFKNGWLPDDINDEWTVTSIGKVTRGDNSYLAVALSDQNPTIEEGSQVIEDLMRISSDYLL
ncbi:class A beta-lactamase-related serine hydrolase [Tetragenococcus halophilus]|uniref:serine hydrolase n=1 Tax=Tetragenococcus halophilus TaxID=51669 RepID=UPI001F315757|nr:serine hydrolase [Tetragenococcus halophilus]MCF1685496.1 class A beta-lactamase-related serine hydrolase [Tetragenococcus halophilus]